MSVTCVVRDANTEDSEAIASLLAQLGYPRSVEFVRSKIVLFQEQPSTRVIVAELCKEAELLGEVVGVLSFEAQPLFHQEGKIGTITALSVASTMRGKNVGRSLVNAIEEIAKEMDCIKIAVASGVQRDDAHAFYRKLGYAENTKRFVKAFSE
jgi:N-acetylglutamate synthase-like GNAT family acetyltransferase